MACEIAVCRGAVFCLWGKPAKSDFDRLLRQLAESAKEFGAPVIYVTRVPAEAPAPDAEVRKYLNSILPRFMESCSSYHVVLEGTGFGAAMKRAVVTGLMQLGFRRGSFFVHASASEVTHHVRRENQPEARAILELAAKRGLLDSTMAVSATPPAGP
jgi:hypothetical protein